MKTYPRVLAYGAFLVLPLQLSLAQQVTRYQYVYPKPDSRYVSKETNIILRPGMELDALSVSALLIRVEGSLSGVHRGTMIFSDDRRTVVFNLREPLAENERVSVNVAAGLRGANGTMLGGVSFRFATAVSLPSPAPMRSEVQRPTAEITGIQDYHRAFATIGDTLPRDFPPIKIDTVNNPAPGKVFFANFGPVSGPGAYGNYLMILDDAGRPVTYRKVAADPSTFAYNFTMQSNGFLSCVERTLTSSTALVLDSSLNVIDRFQGRNGYTGDIVDFRTLPNGHTMMLLYDWQIMDASKLVRGGNPGANICETVIQELDLAKNVVFQWRSIDYIPITDSYVDSLAASIDYMHSNSFEFDKDGGILISSRHLSEITKIDGRTGEILWRLGGKKNQFRFIGERETNKPNYFSYQHDVSRLDNGNIMLFDNGNQHSPQYSRVVEYSLDETNRTATVVWEFRRTPDVYSSANGSAQRLANGNTFIGWGNAGLNGLTAVTEVHPDKSLAFEFTLPKGQRSWRAYRFPWKESPIVAAVSRYDLLQGNEYWFNDTIKGIRTGVKISFSLLQPVFYNGATVTKFSTACASPRFSGAPPQVASTRFVITKYGMTSVNASISFDASMLSELPDPSLVTVYRRDTAGSGTFLPLVTSYNPFSKELAASTAQFGEFVLGWNGGDTSTVTPGLLAPADRDSVNQLSSLVLKWNPKGYTTRSQIQVATDSLFGSLVLNDSLVFSDSDTLQSLMPRSSYYWRIRSFNGSRTSSWSPVWRFSAVGPYIAVLSPHSGEKWLRGKPFFIVWHTNISENVRIDLFRNGTRYSVIKDSASNIGSYTWSIPASIPPDSTYSLRIRSIKDTLVAGFSLDKFTVQTPTGIEVTTNSSPIGYQLQQNYPNPFNPRTAVSFQLPAVSLVKLRILDVLGREIETLLDGERAAGTHVVAWDATSRPSGVYILRMEVTAPDGGGGLRFAGTKKLVLVR